MQPVQTARRVGTRPSPGERRIAAIDAFIDLALRHGSSPRPKDVAAHADVSMASLYRYFDSLDQLRREAMTRLVERFPRLFTVPEIGNGPRAARIERYTAARIEQYEALHPLQILVRTIARNDPTAQALVDDARAMAVDQISLHFEPELSGLGTDRSLEMATTVSIVTSLESWEQCRRSFGRSPAETRTMWCAALQRLVPEAPTP